MTKFFETLRVCKTAISLFLLFFGGNYINKPSETACKIFFQNSDMVKTPQNSDMEKTEVCFKHSGNIIFR